MGDKFQRMFACVYSPRRAFYFGNRLAVGISLVSPPFRQNCAYAVVAPRGSAEILPVFYPWVVDAISSALTFQIKAWSQGWDGLHIEDDLKTESAGEGFVNARYGSMEMGKVKEEHVVYIREALIDFESRVRVWQQYADMKKNTEELKQIKGRLRDELAIITLRRVAPGRCKYCPI